MSTSTNHWKLGLFVVVGALSIIATVVYFGGRTLRKETVSYKTYFDESVQGLEIGSPVKFRGVSIGSVAQIDLAGDKRHVEVTKVGGRQIVGESLGRVVEKRRVRRDRDINGREVSTGGQGGRHRRNRRPISRHD